MLGFGFDDNGRFRHQRTPPTRAGTAKRIRAEIDAARGDAARTIIELDEVRHGNIVYRPGDLRDKHPDWLASRLLQMQFHGRVVAGDPVPHLASRRSLFAKDGKGAEAVSCVLRRTYDGGCSFQVRELPEIVPAFTQCLAGRLEAVDQESLFFLEQRRLVLRELRSDQAAPLLEEPHLLPRIDPPPRSALDLLRRLPEEGLGIVVGPPGTGKTQTISDLALKLQQQGQSCLLLSWTRIAVEEALSRVIERGGRAFRLGRPADPHLPTAAWDNDVDWTALAKEEIALPLFGDRDKDVALLGATFLQAFVRFNAEHTDDEGRFDVVIVDEASQAPFEAVLFAMRAGRRVILLGDPIQLPPVTRADDRVDKRTQQEALDCLSAVLAERTDLHVLLATQYRSLPGIMDWSSHTFYGGMLRNGRAEDDIRLRWPRALLDRVTLVPVPGEGPSNRRNPHTLRKAKSLLTSASKQLTQAGLPLKALYITPYREQADAARDALEHLPLDMTVGTVDASQGKQAPIVAFDLCTSKETTFWASATMARRFNVALTRATHHVVLFVPEGLLASAKIPWLRSLFASIT